MLGMLSDNIGCAVNRNVDGFSFKPSAQKKMKSCSFLPTNLHVGNCYIQHRSPSMDVSSWKNLVLTPVGNVCSITCGVPCAFALSFKDGSLLRLINAYRQKFFTNFNRRTPSFHSPWKYITRDPEDDNELSSQIRRRFDLCFCQAASTALETFQTHLSHWLMGPLSSLDIINTALTRWERQGFLIVFQGLLTPSQNERAMLEDAFVAIYSLSTLYVQLNITVGTRVNVTRGEHFLTCRDSYLVAQFDVTCLSTHHYARSAGKSVKIHIIPSFFNMGVNINQTFASCLFSNQINGFWFKQVNDYIHSVTHNTEPTIPEGIFANSRQLVSVHQLAKNSLKWDAPIFENSFIRSEIDASPYQAHMEAIKLNMIDNQFKNVRLLHLVSETGGMLCGGVVVMCKSGKDRTGMFVTYRQAKNLVLEYQLPISGLHSFRVNSIIHGVRLQNCRKNTGSASFSFNVIQNWALPEELKAPPNWYKRGET